MNEIIKVNYETGESTVSARSLYEGLEIKKRFSAWFDSNNQGFIEGEDFTSVLSGTEQAKENMSIGGSYDKSLSPNGETLLDRKIHTDKELAKMAGVGTGTIARYNRVMNSNDDDLKEKVKTGQVSVNKAYEEVRKRETRICKMCGKEKKIIDFFGNDTICKECSRKESEKNINAQKSSSSLYPANDMQDVYDDVLTAKNAKDQINQDYEINWLKDKCHDFISQVNDKFFDLLGVIEKMDREHINEAYDIFKDFYSINFY